MSCVALLPQELSCSDERSWMLELPSDDICPLVQLQRKISMTLDPFSICRVHDGLTCRTNSNRLVQLALT